MSASLLSGLVWLLLCLSVQGQRAAEYNCKEYRKIILNKSFVIPLVLNPTPIEFSSFNCSKTVDLIVGGEAANPGEFPHQALLGYEIGANSEQYDFQCGGTLISERYVLTAAHCMKSGTPKIVRLGEHNLADDTDGQVDFKIEQIMRYPKHTFSSSYHDIALIRLSENVTFSKFIRPACLWTGFPLNTSSLVATGFGFTEFAGNKSDVLQKVVLNFLNKTECVAQYRSHKAFRKGIINEQLCVGSTDGGKDTCVGDSGGPIQVVTEPKQCTYHVVGVTSAGTGCGQGRSPSIYTRVASYVRWIEEHVWPHFYSRTW